MCWVNSAAIFRMCQSVFSSTHNRGSILGEPPRIHSLPHKPYIVATVHSEQVIQFASGRIGRIHQCTEANTNFAPTL